MQALSLLPRTPHMHTVMDILTHTFTYSHTNSERKWLVLNKYLFSVLPFNLSFVKAHHNLGV